MKLAAAALLTAATLLGQSPLSQEQIDALVPKLRNSALRYRGQLPNFICIQTTVESEDSSGTGNKWKRGNTYEEDVAFVDYKPHYSLSTINGKIKPRPILRAHYTDILPQAIVPTWVFGPRSQAAFTWDRWDKLKNRPVMVMRFKTPLVVALNFNGKSYNLGFHGVAYFTESDPTLMRLEVEADYPPNFPANNPRWSWKTDYTPVKIGDRDFILPDQLVLETQLGKTRTKNEEKFSNYRQFSATSSVVEDAPAR